MGSGAIARQMMGCDPHGFSRISLTDQNSRVMKRSPSPGDPEHVQLRRDIWNRRQEEEKRQKNA